MATGPEKNNESRVGTGIRHTTHGRTAYALGFPEHAFPEHSPTGADLMVLFPFAPFTSIVPTAGPKSKSAPLRIHRIHDSRIGGTLLGELWPAHELFEGEQEGGVGGDGAREK